MDEFAYLIGYLVIGCAIMALPALAIGAMLDMCDAAYRLVARIFSRRTGADAR
jgi:hypothetical protein